MATSCYEPNEPKYHTLEEHKALLAAEIAKWPETFGLRGFPGLTFKISESDSYFPCLTATVPTLYLARKTDSGEWSAFVKGTPSEIRREAVIK